MMVTTTAGNQVINILRTNMYFNFQKILKYYWPQLHPKVPLMTRKSMRFTQGAKDIFMQLKMK